MEIIRPSLQRRKKNLGRARELTVIVVLKRGWQVFLAINRWPRASSLDHRGVRRKDALGREVVPVCWV